jgi:hypothetical protein
MKKNVFLMGILSVVLVFGMALFVGCDDGGGDSGPSTPAFDGSSLAGTTWGAEETVDLSEMADGAEAKIKGKRTLNFTSAAAGTITAVITDFIGADWDDETKKMIKAMVEMDKVPFTPTYDSTAKTGTVTYSTPSFFEEGKTETTKLSFTVDVSAKTLTTTDDDDKDEITVYKLQ